MKRYLRLSLAGALAAVLSLAGCGPEQVATETAPGTDEAALSELVPIIDAVLSGSIVERREVVQFLTTPCTTADGLGGPPKCAAGEAEGTLVEVFPVGGAEGSFAHADEIDRALEFSVKELYAAYRVPATANPEEAFWPSGDYALLFDGDGSPSSFPITALVQDGKIVRLNHHLGSTAADILAGIPAENILMAPGLP